MIIANFEHIATGYPKQCQITIFEYLMFKVVPNKFLDRMEKKFNLLLDYEFFFSGVTYVR